MVMLKKKLPGQKCKPPKWNTEDKTAYDWCIKHSVRIVPVASYSGMYVDKWWIDVYVGDKVKRSPYKYGVNQLWPKIFELYRFYYDKNMEQ